jgi:hypothetical protein
MTTFIVKVDGKKVVKFKHRNQIFTIQAYNGYSSGKDAEWMKDCLDRFFEKYEEDLIATYKLKNNPRYNSVVEY